MVGPSDRANGRPPAGAMAAGAGKPKPPPRPKPSPPAPQAGIPMPPPPPFRWRTTRAKRRVALVVGASALALLLSAAALLLLQWNEGTGRGGSSGSQDDRGVGTSTGAGGAGAVTGGSSGPGPGNGAANKGDTPGPGGQGNTPANHSHNGEAKPEDETPHNGTASDTPQELVFYTHRGDDSPRNGGSRSPGSGSTGSGRGGGGRRGGRALGTGDVSFRLYWKPPFEDIDLHVVDPNGHHLWYIKTTCPCDGRLDRDDTTSGGPENIFWPTGKGPRGTYVYYALYYRGTGPKRVILEVRKKGKVIRKHTHTLRREQQTTKRFTYEH